MDAAITERWHDATVCDGTFRCPCKKRITLSKQDIRSALMLPSSSEQATYLKFQQLYTWGFKEIWDKLPGEQNVTL